METGMEIGNFLYERIPQKLSWEYILLSTFKQKTAFLAIFKPKSAGNRLFSAPFLFVSAGWKLICLL
jgi:hypothetical protein